MTKMTLASYPHMLGFEQLERLMERTAKTGNEGYPPFNIEQTSPTSLVILSDFWVAKPKIEAEKAADIAKMFKTIEQLEKASLQVVLSE